MNNQKYQIPTVTLITEGGGEHEFLSLEGTIELPSWKDFRIEFGNYAKPKGNDDYKFIRLSIGGDEVIENPTINQEHVTAYDYLLHYQEKIKVSMLNELFNMYPNLKEQYGYDDEDADSIMPDVKTAASFSALIELSSIYILNVSKDGIAYVGFQFCCTWDDEHGLGIMTHKDRIIKIGGADSAFLTWIAKKDLNTKKVNSDLEANHSLGKENFNIISDSITKPWWKFW